MVVNTYLFEFEQSILPCVNDSVFQWLSNFSSDFRWISFAFIWSSLIIHKLLLHLCRSHWSTAIILVLKWSRSVLSDSLQPTDCSLPRFSFHGILQAGILEWVTISFSRASSRTWAPRTAGRLLTVWATSVAPMVNVSSFPMPVSLGFVYTFICIIFRFHVWLMSYNCLSVSEFVHLVW